MKNIHILPTDKPSRLYKQTGVLLLDTISDISKDGISRNQHIYITSNEDINENDYFITKDGRLVDVSYLLSKDLEGASKVVLTTDQDLIKDGVQAIDDEFLEWFVKNPSCDEVEVTYGVLKPFHSEEKGYLIHCPNNEILEEPKQENCCTPIGQIKRYLNCKGCDRKPKQLTDLEIAIKLEEIEREEPKQETTQGKYVIIDIRNMDFMKNEKDEINYYDTEEQARLVCGMYEFENAWVMKLIYNHIEP